MWEKVISVYIGVCAYTYIHMGIYVCVFPFLKELCADYQKSRGE